MSEPNVLLDIKDRIATVTLNDPERRNPITGNDMIEALLEKVAKVQADPEVSVMILTGAGSAFCAGGDIKEMNDPDGVFRKEPLAAAQSYVDGVQRLPQALYNLDIPTIAAVNGAAVGAGCDLTMMCDMRIASEKAKFGEVFLNLGIIPGDAGSWFLLRRLGHQRAADLTFSWFTQACPPFAQLIDTGGKTGPAKATKRCKGQAIQCQRRAPLGAKRIG